MRAFSRLIVFFLKVFPMLPSRFLNRITPTPLIERVQYPTTAGMAEGDLYRPSSPGTNPGIVVCLGVVPFEVNHPQVPRLGEALARAGFVVLLYWSPAMRDFRLVSDDIENISLAYDWLIKQPFVDASRSGLLGTCVGGSYAIMAAAQPLVRGRLAFLSAYAPFSSINTFAKDILTSSVEIDGQILPWKVDQLTRRVFVHSLTDGLEDNEAQKFRTTLAFDGKSFDGLGLSEDGRKIYEVLTGSTRENADEKLKQLPDWLQEKLKTISPVNHLDGLKVPLFVILHDAGDQVIPVGESRRLVDLLQSRQTVNYTEMHFSHLDPAKGKLPLPRLIWEFGKFIRAMLPLFQQTS